MHVLKTRLLNDLAGIGIPTDFELVIREYSKKFYGTYNPNLSPQRVTLYVYEDEQRENLYTYEHLLYYAIHEAVHHIQHTNPKFIRYKGVAHNPEFFSLLHGYENRAKAKALLKEVISSDCKSKKVFAKASLEVYAGNTKVASVK